MFQNRTTIAAISTPSGESGIGIIRISGPEAAAVADRVLDRKISPMPSHTIHYRHVLKDGKILDEVLVTLLRGPKSYTGEDSVEINCHGNAFLMRRVLEVCLDQGAVLAEPGEFTKRAFLNGRIDLGQAEAVMDLIRAQSDRAADTAISQLSGVLSGRIREIRSSLLDETARIEAALDDPEHYDLTGYPEELKEKISGILSQLKKLISGFDSGRVLKDGINTVILGKPNAGKSSLLNLFSGEERAIVTDIPGTTRDTLTEQIRMGSFSLNLTDTAGIRDSEDPIEKIGIERAREKAEEADLLLILLDSSCPLEERDRELLSFSEHQAAIILLNKSDLPECTGEEEVRRLTSHPVLSISARTGGGINDLKEEIEHMLFSGIVTSGENVIITNLRHLEALKAAEKSLLLVLDSIGKELPEDFYSIDLMDACRALGQITGEDASEDVIDRIFEKFCMGK